MTLKKPHRVRKHPKRRFRFIKPQPWRKEKKQRKTLSTLQDNPILKQRKIQQQIFRLLKKTTRLPHGFQYMVQPGNSRPTLTRVKVPPPKGPIKRKDQHTEGITDYIKPIKDAIEKAFLDHFKIKDKVRLATLVIKILLEIAAILKSKNAKMIILPVLVIDIVDLLLQLFDITDVFKDIAAFVERKVEEFFEENQSEEPIYEEIPTPEEAPPDMVFQTLLHLKDGPAFAKFIKAVSDKKEKMRFIKAWRAANGPVFEDHSEDFRRLELLEESIQIIRSKFRNKQCVLSYYTNEISMIRKKLYALDTVIDHDFISRKRAALILLDEPPPSQDIPEYEIPHLSVQSSTAHKNIKNFLTTTDCHIIKPEKIIHELTLAKLTDVIPKIQEFLLKPTPLVVPDYRDPGTATLYCSKEGEVRINGFCFFKTMLAVQTGIMWKKNPTSKKTKKGRKLEPFSVEAFESIEDFCNCIVEATGIDIGPRFHYVEDMEDQGSMVRVYDFEGIDPVEASTILTCFGQHTTIHYGVWAGEFELYKGHFESSATEQITAFKSPDRACLDTRVDIAFIEKPFCHWMPMRTPSATQKTEGFEMPAMDFSFLAENWSKIITWIAGLGTAVLASKALNVVDLDKIASNAMSNITNFSKASTELGKMEEFIKTTVLKIETPTQKRIKELLSYDDLVNKAMSVPQYIYFREPWREGQLKTTLDQIKEISVHLNDPALNNAKNILVATYTAGIKFWQEIKKGLSQRDTRIIPTTAYFYGDEGAGKTELMKDLAHKLITKRSYPKQGSVYSFKPDKHFDPYHQEPIAILDEAFSKNNLEDDAVVGKFNAIVSADNVNLAGAAIDYKDAPCSFEYFLIGTNTTPEDLKTRLPLNRDAIPAFFSRLLIFECKYNQGPTEMMKPRNQRRRLPNHGHIDFNVYRFDSNVTPQFVLMEEKVPFRRVDELLEKEYQINKAYFDTSRAKFEAEGLSKNHFVINFNGPPNRGKTETLATLSAFFGAYDFPVVDAEFGKFPTLDPSVPVFVKVDDQVKMEGDKVDPRAESWYMQLFNTLPNNSIIAVATNIELSKEIICSFTSGRIGAAAALVRGRKPSTCKVRKGPFSNVGMYRRMGYCGHFRTSEGIEKFSHNLEFNTTQTGFKDFLTKATYVSSPTFYTYIKTKYENFLNIYQSFLVTHSVPPPYTPDVTVFANVNIVNEVKNTTSLFKMLTKEGTATGNRIIISPRLEAAMEDVPTDSLAPRFKPEYNQEGIVQIAKQFINVLLPKIGTFSMQISAENIGKVVSINRSIYITAEDEQDSEIKFVSYNPENHFCQFKVEKEMFTIDMLLFYSSVENEEVFKNFIHLPPRLIEFLRRFCDNIAKECPPLAKKIASRNKQNLRDTIKKDTLLAARKLWAQCKKHPYWTAFIALCGSLLGLGALISLLRKDKKFLDPTHDTIRTVMELQHEYRLKKMGMENEYEEKSKKLSKMSQSQLKIALCALATTEGKTPAGNLRKLYNSHKGKMYKHRDGYIMYTDDHGNIQTSYSRIQDAISDQHNGKNVKDFSKDEISELSFAVEAKSYIELEKAHPTGTPRPPSQPQSESYHPSLTSPEKVRTSQHIVQKIRHNGVIVLTPIGKNEKEVAPESDGFTPVMFGMGLKGRFLIAPRHLIIGKKNTSIYVADGRTVAADSVISQETLFYKAKMVYAFPEEEIVLFQIVSNRFPAFADITPYIAIPPQQSVTSENVYLVRKDGQHHHGVATYMSKGVILQHEGKNYQTLNAASVTYGSTSNPLTAAGSCGLPYFLDTENTSKIFCGFHIASNSLDLEYGGPYISTFQCIFSDHLAILEREMLKHAPPTPQKTEINASALPTPALHEITNRFLLSAQSSLEKGKVAPLLPKPQSDRVKIVGTTKTSVDKNFKNQYSPTIFSSLSAEIIPNTQLPTCYNLEKLTSKEKRELDKNTQGVPSAAVTQDNKWSDPLPEGESEKFLQEIREDMTPYFSQFFRNYRTLNEEETLNGIRDTRDPNYGIKSMEIDSYPGYILEREFNVKKKSDIIKCDIEGFHTFRNCPGSEYVKEWLQFAEESLNAGKQPFVIYKSCLKVEKLPAHKRHTGRTFMMGSTESVMLERKYLASYCNAHHRNPASHNALGISIPDFDFIAREFKRLGGKGFAGDYSRFDRHNHERLLDNLCKTLKEAAILAGVAPELAHKLSIVLRNSFRCAFITTNTVCTKRDGVNSGAMPTQNINSDSNFQMVYAGFKRCAEKKGFSRYEIFPLFMEKVRVWTYGDDLLVAVHPTIQSWFNLKTLSKYLGDTWGMKLDTATKDGKVYEILPFEELSFISRTPTKIEIENGVTRYAGAIKINTISGLVHWTTSNTPEQIAANLSFALVEAAICSEKLFNKIVRIIHIAMRNVPGLSSELTLVPRKMIIQQMYEEYFGFTGAGQRADFIKNFESKQTFYSGTKLSKFQLESFIQEEILMGNCLSGEDYVSELNLMWQANKITQPVYCDDGTRCRLTFVINANKRAVDVIGIDGNKKQRKQQAAQRGLEAINLQCSTAEADTAGTGEAAQCLATWKEDVQTQSSQTDDIPDAPTVQTTSQNRTSRTPYKGRKPSHKSRDLSESIVSALAPLGDYLVENFQSNVYGLKPSFPALIYQSKGSPYISVSFINQDRNVASYYRLKNINQAYSDAIKLISGFSLQPLLISKLYVIKIYNPLDKTTMHKWQMHLKPMVFRAEMDTATPAQVPAHEDASLTAMHNAVDSAGSEAIPVLGAGLPTQTAVVPSMALTGAGEVFSSVQNNCDVIDLNPITDLVEIPENSGRAFSIEEYLYENWIPMADTSFNSSSKKGEVLFTMSANPMGLTTLHNMYANMHKSAIFSSEHLIYIVSAQNVAAALLVGWVPDINKSTFSIQEVMATSWKILDLNGNKVLKFTVRDARQEKFYRNLADNIPCPGLVMMVQAPLNNMFATSSTFAVTIQRYARFAKQTKFFNPKFPEELTSSALTEQSYFSPTESTSVLPLSTFGTQTMSLFIGGNMVPGWRDLIKTGRPYMDYPWPFVQQGTHPVMQQASGVNGIIGGYCFLEANQWDISQPINAYAGTDALTQLNVQQITGGSGAVPNINNRLLTVTSLTARRGTTTEQRLVEELEMSASWEQDFEPEMGFISNSEVENALTHSFQLSTPILSSGVSWTQLSGDIKTFDFILPSQSGLVDDVKGYQPLRANLTKNLINYLDGVRTQTGTISFDISNASGILATVVYVKGVGFFCSCPQGNLVTGGVNPATLFLSNFGTAALSGVTPRDYSGFLSFISPAQNTMAALERRAQQMTVSDFRPETQGFGVQRTEAAAAGAIAQAVGGIFGAIGQGVQTYVSYQQWKEEMEQQNEQFYSNQDLQRQLAQGQWANNLALDNQKAANSLKMAGVTSSAAQNAAQAGPSSSGASGNVRPRSDWGTVNVYNNFGSGGTSTATASGAGNVNMKGPTHRANLTTTSLKNDTRQPLTRSNIASIAISPTEATNPNVNTSTQTTFQTANASTQSSPVSSATQATQTPTTGSGAPSRPANSKVPNLTQRQLRGTNSTSSSRGFNLYNKTGTMKNIGGVKRVYH